MNCVTCRHDNQANARFCSECGAPLARSCPACGAEHPPTARFCDQCGAVLSTGTGAATSGPTPAVRKQVTALFADLVGATAFGERVDPEAARASLAPYFAILQSTITDHAGTVAKFTGDGVMALFGVPSIAEDDALRAVAAGLDLQRRFRTLAEQVQAQHDVELGLRVGVNTGELVVADDDADLVGDVLNTAARLEAVCAPGRVLVGEDTWRLTRSSVAYEVLGEVHVKGKAEAIAAFQVVDESVGRPDEVTPFVGRSLELDELGALLHDAVTHRSARLATVIGAAGVGKTRLAHELRAGVDASAFDLRFERRGSTTFTPILELLRDLTGTGSPDDVARLVDGHPEAERLATVLAALLGHGESRTTEESFWAVRRLFEMLAADGPAIVVVDDIQWAEPLFWDLLDHLVEWTAAPVLIMALARPELRDLRPELARAGRHVNAAISLEGLDADTTRELAAQILGIAELPVELADRLPESTEGNPLFVRELVQMLVVDGVLARDGDRWHLTIDADAIEVPPTILSLLASRVERLPDDERQVVELASVIGTEFDRGALAAIAEGEIASRLGALIDRLRRKDLIEPAGVWAGDQPVDRFHHVLIRDAAYRRLLKGHRAELHERVGRHMETDAEVDAEVDVIVAHHYEQVYRYRTELGTVDDDTRELADAAVTRLRFAAEQALAREDLPSAGNFALRALDLVGVDAGGERDELLLLGCEALLSSGGVERGAPLVEELHLRRSDDRRGAWADCFRAQLWSLTDPDHLTDADELAASAAERLAELGDDAGVAKARLVRAGCLARLGRVGDCEEELDRALGAARAAGDRRRTVAVLGAAPLAALWGPSPVARAGGRCLDVLRLLRITTASPAVEATSIRCQGMLEALRGRFDSARAKLETSRTTARDIGLRQGLYETELFAGFVELWAGDPSAAEPHLRAAQEGLGRLGIGADAGQAGALLARSLLLQGRIEEADVLATDALETAGQNLQTAIASRSVLAEIRAQQGRHDEAGRLIDEAIDIVGRTDVTLDHALTLLAAARVGAAAGDAEHARRLSDAASTLLSAKGVTAFFAVDDDPQRPTPEASLTTDDGLTDIEQPPPDLTNSAWEFMRDFNEVWRARDTDRMQQLLHPDFRSTSRLAIVSHDSLDRDDDTVHTNDLTAIAGVEPDQSLELIAIRGDDICLVRSRVRYEGDELERLAVVQISDGLGRSFVWLDSDALLDAIDELEDQWIAAEQHDTGTVESLMLLRRVRRSMAAGDLHALRACLSDDFVARDRGRRAMLGERSAEEWITTLAPTEAGSFVAVPLAQLATCRNGGFFINSVTVGDANWGTALIVYQCRNGLATALEHFELDDLDAAGARYEELVAVESSTPSHDPAEVWNRALELSRAAIEPGLAGDRETLLTLFAPDFATSDRGRLADAVGFDGRQGAESWVDFILDFVSLGSNVAMRIDPIAVRGEHHALVRFVAELDGSEFRRLFVVETDDRQATREVWFDEDQLLDAVDELEDQWLAGVQPDDETVAGLMLFRRARRLMADWDAVALRRCLADDFVAVDNRTLGLGKRSVDEYLESMEPSDAGSYVTVPTEQLAAGGRGALFRISVSAGDERLAHLAVAQYCDGLFTRLELFDEDDAAAASARYDELAGDAAGFEPWSGIGRLHHPLEALADRFVEHLNRGDLHTARGELFEPGFERIDRRPVVAFPTVGLDGFLAAISQPENHPQIARAPLVAVRPNAYLGSSTTTYADGATNRALVVVSAGPTGRIGRLTVFDHHDLEPALSELDRSWVAGGGPADVVEYDRRHREVFRRGTIDELVAYVAPDFVSIDHRSLGMGERHAEEWIASVEELVGHADVVLPEVIDHRGPLRLSRGVFRSDDGSVLIDSYIIADNDIDGRLTRIELFSDDQLDLARRRLDELAREARPGNEAFRLLRLFGAAWERRDRARARSILADDFQLASRRSFRVGAPLGADRFADYIIDGSTNPDGFRTRHSLLAFRGDDHCLVRVSDGTDGVEQHFLTVVQSANGRLYRQLLFDESDLEAAVAELDRQYLASLRLDHDPRVARLWPAMYSNDVAEFADLLHPDFELVSHTSTFPTMDRGDSVTMMPVPGGVDVDIPAVHRVCADAVIFERRERTGDDAAEWNHVVLVAFENEQIRRMEVFLRGDLADALARYDEITADADRANRRSLPNRSARAAADAITAIVRDGLEAHRDLFSPDVVFETRRRSSLPTVSDADRGAESIEWLRRQGARSVVVGDIAVRGDSLCLQRWLFRFENGDEFEQLELGQLDDDGRLVLGISYDVDQLVEAQIELDRRWMDELGFPGDHIARTMAATGYETDPQRAAAHFHPAMTFVNHRKLAYASGNRATLADVLDSAFFEMVVTMPVIHRIDERGAVVERVETAVDEIGENRMIILVLWEHGLTVRLEGWDTDDLDAALARYDELVADQSGGEPSNQAWSVARAIAAALAAVDRDRFAALLADDFVATTFDPVMQTVGEHGRMDGALSLDVRLSPEMLAFGSPTQELIAIRGEHLAMYRAAQDTDSDDVVESLLVIETRDGQAVRLDHFPHDGLADAHLHLDRRWVAHGCPEIVVKIEQSFRAAFAGGSAEDMGQICAPGFTVVDHRPMGMGTRNRDQWIESTAALAGTVEMHVPEYLAVTDRLVLCCVEMRSKHDDSRWSTLVLNVHDGELVTRMEQFADVDREAALTRLDELAIDDQAATLGNGAWRVVAPVFDALGQQDFASLADLLPVDFEARPAERLTVGTDAMDRATFLRRVDEFVRSGNLSSFANEVIAVRGDDLCLVRSDYRFGDDRIGRLTVVEVQHGHPKQITIFDDDRLLDAQVELNRMYLGKLGYGSEHWLTKQVGTWIRGVVDELGHLMHPDYRLVDHRQLGWPTADRDTMVARMADFGAVKVLNPEIFHISELGWVASRVEYLGDGTELDDIVVQVLDGQLTRWFELFEPHQLDAALARFEELTISSGND